MNQHYDIVIIGGGLVGATLACALEPLSRTQGLTLAVVEQHPVNTQKPPPSSFDARSSAISYGTQQAYEKIGLWSSLAHEAALIKQVHISDEGHFGITRLDHKSENVPALGYVIDNCQLGKVLFNALNSYQEYITFFSPATVTTLQPLPGKMSITLCDARERKSTLTASLVVLADGGRSGLMEKLGISKEVHGYGQHAVIANIIADKPYEGIAYERFSRNGPIALLPKLPFSEQPNKSPYGLIWTLNQDKADEVMALDNQAFIKALQNSFGYRAGRFLYAGRRDRYSLSMSLAREQVRPNLVVLGNAAHTIHPIAGQGYNLAIRDVMTLLETITSAVRHKEPVGNLRQLMKYLKKQEADQKRVIAFCDGLIKLFSRKETPVVLARNLGLLALDCSGPFKRRFAKAAMGL